MYVIKLFKNKVEMVVYIILFVLLLVGFIYFGTRNYEVDKPKDSEIFKVEHYEVDEDNVYKYVNASEAYNLVKTDNVVILFGTKDNEWFNYYANILNRVCKEVGVNVVYFYDITQDRNEKNGTYQAIVDYLKDYITYLDDGTANIYAPTLLVKSQGVISLFDDETALIKGTISPKNYWTSYKEKITKSVLKEALTDYLKGVNNGE